MWMDLDDSVLSSTGIEVELRKGKRYFAHEGHR